MKIFDFGNGASGSPDSAEWHEWRARHIGASDAPVIAAHAGLIKKAAWMPSLHTLWMQKTGQEERPAPNFAMQRGRDLEEPARAAFEQQTGIYVFPAFGECDEASCLSASFDGLTFGQETIVEIKAPGAAVHAMAIGGEVVEYYLPQLAHQSIVAWGFPENGGWEGKKVVFVSFRPGSQEGQDLAIVEVNMRDLAILATRMKPHLLAFGQRLQEWFDGLQPDAPAAPDGLKELAEQYMLIDDEISDLTEDKDTLRAKLIRLAEDSGTAKIEGHGLIVGKSEIKGSIDYKALLEDLKCPEEKMEQFRGEGRQQWTVKISTKGQGDSKTARRRRRDAPKPEVADPSWTW